MINENEIRNIAWEFLIKSKISVLPINPIELCKQYNWDLFSYSEVSGVLGISTQELKAKYGNSDAVSRLKKGKLSIIYNDKVGSAGRTNFSIMVEIAHHLLFHTVDNYQTEHEAMMLAIRILAPLIVIYKCNIICADDIAKMCSISHQSANFRLERLNKMKSKNKFLTHPLEAKVYEQFKPFIQNYVLNAKNK